MCSLFGKTTTDEIPRSSSSGIQHVRLPDGTSNDDLAPIAESLHENMTLQSLGLLSCFTTDREGGEIITALDLSNNNAIAFIGHATAGDLLAKALRHNTSLQELDIKSCGLTGADVSCVFQSLARLRSDNRWAAGFHRQQPQAPSPQRHSPQ
jgi:hypothetical protein